MVDLGSPVACPLRLAGTGSTEPRRIGICAAAETLRGMAAGVSTRWTHTENAGDHATGAQLRMDRAKESAASSYRRSLISTYPFMTSDQHGS